MKHLRLLPEVLHDTANAADWYDEEGHAGLGNRFLAIFDAALPLIQDHGEVYRPVYQDFRRMLLPPFPYAVYYRYFEDWVVISLVIHAARSPRLVRKLLRRRRSNT
jgi:hypothetical protein